MQNSPEKCTQWCGPKFVHLGPKMTFFCLKWNTLGHFHTTGCIFLANFASRVDPPNMFHCDPPFVPLLPSIWGLLGLLWPKKEFWAQNWPFLGHFHSIGCIFLTSFVSRVVPPHVFRCDPPFVPLLAATRGPWGHLWPKIAFFAQYWPFLGHFHTIGCIFPTSFATKVVLPHVFRCDPHFDPLLPAI